MVIYTASETKVKKNLLIPLVFLLFSIILISIAINTNDYSNTAFLWIVSVFFITYSSIRLYSQIYLHKDFIDINKDRIIFRETPTMAMGLFPQNKTILIEDIESVDLVEVQQMFSLNEGFKAIKIVCMEGEYILASKLSEKNQIQALLAMKGLVTFSSNIIELLSSEKVGEKVKQVVNVARDIWRRVQEE